MPFQVREVPAFFNPFDGKPIGLGFVYIGVEDTDPTVLGNRINVTITQEDGTEVIIAPASQPLDLNPAGQIIYQGSPVLVQVPTNYSITVQDRLEEEIFYLPFGFPQQESALILPITTTPATVTDAGHVYTQRVAGIPELFYQDDEGNQTQLTDQGEVNAPVEFSSGTRMVFFQSTTPIGWTQITTFDDYMLRVVSGIGGGSGGNSSPIDFSQSFNHTHTTGDHVLTAEELPSDGLMVDMRRIAMEMAAVSGAFGFAISDDPGFPNDDQVDLGSVGSSNSHNHGETGEAEIGADFAPRYLDMILGEKN